MIKIAVLVIIMNIAQAIDSRNNIFLELMNMSRNALFAGKNVCMPHPPSVKAGIPWVAHPISHCDTCTLFGVQTSGIFNRGTCHHITTPPASPCCIPGLPSCNLTSATPIMTDLLLPITFPWCMENDAPASTPLGEIPHERCSFVIKMRTNSHVDITPSSGREEKDLEVCLHRTASLPKFFSVNQWCMIPPPTGTFWLCGTSVYNILPSQFNGRCTLVYVLPAIRENTHSSPSSPHLLSSAPTTDKEDGCIPGLTCAQTWWSRTLGALIPSYGVIQALDQVRSLSNSVQKLANDTALALGNITDTLASHKIMILQNRVALDYILATQGGACTIIGPECCTGLMDPTENLNKIQRDILDLSEKLHQMTEDNSSWFGELLGKPWLWIKEIAILLLFFLLVYYLCVHSIKCFIQQMTHDHHEETTVPTRKDYYPNWCSFVQKRSVTVAVSCGTEKYTIKSQSPCPNGTPDCQLIMYKLSTRPVYRQKEKIYTALLWRCCAGHAGKNCEETVTDGHVSESEDPTIADTAHLRGPEATDRRYNKLTPENREQNDYQMFGGPLYEAQQQTDGENQTAEEPVDDYEHSRHAGHDHRNHFERRDPNAVNEGVPQPEVPNLHHGLLPILKEAVMSQLQPVLENFNLTLERLSQEVEGLQRDMAQLRHDQGQGRFTESLEVGGEEHEPQEALEAELRESLQKLEEVKAQFHHHRVEVEARLHAQHTMLHYNLTNFKTDTDVKLKRNQKMLQVTLHSLNTSMSEVRQEQERLDEELQKIWSEKTTNPAQSQPYESTAVWEAITRLDNKVINNTVRLSGLVEGHEQVTENIKDLQNVSRHLDKEIVQTGRDSQIRFMETGLEVEAAKVRVLDRINELNGSISTLQDTVQEMGSDVDHLFEAFHNNTNSASGDLYDCIALRASVNQLERTVAYVRAIASENKLARERESQERLDNQDIGALIPSVEDLKLGLLNVQKSLAFEQEKSRMLQHNVSQLQASLLGSQQDIETFQENDRAKDVKIQNLHSSFNILLQDAIRHSEILEILLGEEVLEFMALSLETKRSFSIPELNERIRDMQEQINGHSRSLASMLNSANPQVTAADDPSVRIKRKRGDERSDLFEILPEYSDNDFLTLEKMVKELGVHIKRLEEHRCPSCCNCTKTAVSSGVEMKLQSEVDTLRKDLETHIQVFKSIFSNKEGLISSDVSVDLNKLSALMKRNEAKQQNRKQKRGDNRAVQTGGRMNYRNKRDASLESAVLRQLPDSPIMFLASSTEGANGSGTLLFESVTLNHGQLYSPKTGIFCAPTSGAYLFVVTLDFGPGPSLAQLKKGREVVASLRQNQRKLGAPATRVCILQMEQGEELRLELVQGTVERNNPQDNTFAGLLMLQTT